MRPEAKALGHLFFKTAEQDGWCVFEAWVREQEANELSASVSADACDGGAQALT